MLISCSYELGLRARCGGFLLFLCLGLFVAVLFWAFLPLDRILLLAHPLLTQQIQSKEASLLYKKQRAWLENTNAGQNLQEC